MDERHGDPEKCGLESIQVPVPSDNLVACDRGHCDRFPRVQRDRLHPTGQSCQFMCGGDLTGMYCAEDKSGNIPYGESCGPVPGDDCQRGAECMLRWYSDAGVPAYGTCQAYCQTDAQCLEGEHCKAITCLTDPSKPAHECVKNRPEDGSGG